METRTLIRIDKNGTAYYNVVYPCYSCRGTGKSIGHEVGDVITVSGTIKEHNEYPGEKQTVLTRCKVAA